MNDYVATLDVPRLIDRVTGDREVSTLLADEGLASVFDIAKLTREQFVARHGAQLNGNAAAMHEQATSYANQLLHAARALRMGQRRRTPFPEGGGIPDAYLAVGGPTYQQQFNEPWTDLCKPGAIEAADSPVAYLADLYRLALELEQSAGAAALKLATRRPDIAQLVLDVDSTYQVLPTLSLVNEVLEAAITPNLGGQALDEVLATSRYPFNLPFDLWSHQNNLALQAQGTDLGQVIAQADLDAPYFTQVPEDPTLLTPLQTRALLASSGLSEEAYALINEPMPASDEEAKIFLRRHYGFSEQDTNLTQMISQLSQVPRFLQATGLSGEALDHLFAQGEYRAKISVPGSGQTGAQVTTQHPVSDAEPEPISDAHNYYGASYINGPVGEKGYLHAENGLIQGLDVERLWRINTFVRLQRWSGLSYDKLDHLISSANWHWVDSLGIHGLGLYHRWRDHYQATPDVLSMLLAGGRINLCALGNETPQYDQWFGARPGVSEALVMDGGTFDPNDLNDPTVQKLCTGLQLTGEDWRLLCSLLEYDYHLPSSRGLLQLGMFCRVVAVPRLFGLNITEGMALLELVGRLAPAWLSHIITCSSDGEDSVPGLLACESLAIWLRSINLAPSALRQLLGLSDEIPVETPELVRFAQELREHALAECLLSERFIQRGFPALDDGGQVLDWQALLSAVLDAHGLVLALDDRQASTTITEAVAAAITPLRLAEAVKDALKPQAVTLLLEARAAQATLVNTALAKLFGNEVALVPGLLQWAERSAYAVLAATFDTAARQVADLAPSASTTPYVELLYRLSRYAQLITILQLSAPALALFLAHPGWLDGHPLTVEPSLPLNVPSVYWLSRWRELLNQSPLPEEKVLSYLMAANTRPTPDDCAARLAEVLDWDQASVEALFAEAGRPLHSLRELDWALRLQQLTRELRVPVSTVLAVRGTTAAFPTRAEYQPLAQALMASLAGDGEDSGGAAAAARQHVQAQSSSRPASLAPALADRA